MLLRWATCLFVYLVFYAAIADGDGAADASLSKDGQVIENTGITRAHRVKRYGFWRRWWRPWGWGWGCCCCGWWGWGWGR
ncbi:hypothetical protein QR680_001259 [Steinernema hermaphroditum]|uniref:Secreted protein n=1 Tax=Steinernema hermaphroditum TaxID=289476 RepID=A0AA39H0B8_9BILA|nr:hypothetical protein QR680_001259 [Steinernema hermaphroditum]